jgi:hypothetical protein
MLRIPHCIDKRLTDGGEVVSPMQQPHSAPQKKKFLLLLLVHVTVQLEGSGKLKKIIDLKSTTFCASTKYAATCPH